MGGTNHMNVWEQHRRTNVAQLTVLWLLCGHCTCRGSRSKSREVAGSCDRAPGERRGRWGDSDSSDLIYCWEGVHRKSHYFHPHLPLDDTWIINNSKTNDVLTLLVFVYSVSTPFPAHSSRVTSNITFGNELFLLRWSPALYISISESISLCFVYM